MDFSDARPRLPAPHFSALSCGFPRGHFSFSGHADIYWPCLVPKALFHRLRRRQLLLRTFRFHFVYTYAGRPMVLKNFWRARFARIYPAYAFSLLVTAPFFFYAVLTMNFPFFVWAKTHLKLASALVLSLLHAWGATGSSYMERGRLEPVRRSLFLRFVSVLAAGPRSPLAAAVVAHSCRVLVDVSCLSGSDVVLNPDRLSIVNADVLGAFWLNALKFNPLARLPEFLLGMACGFLFLRSRRESKLASLLVLSGIAALLVVVYFSAVILVSNPAHGFARAGICGHRLRLALRPNWGMILENRWLVLCGDASYSLYLLHSMIVGMYFHSTTGQLRYQSPMGILVFVLIAVSISALVYRFIEEPARRKLNPRREPQLGSIETQPPLEAAPA